LAPISAPCVLVWPEVRKTYLPSSGDQFSALTPGLVIAQPERFENTEVGVKYDVSPVLQLNR
jgi:hypothetical protein